MPSGVQLGYEWETAVLASILTNATLTGLAMLAVLGVIVWLILDKVGKTPNVRLFRWRWLGLMVERNSPPDPPQPELEDRADGKPT
jgi:hypothetical protein